MPFLPILSNGPAGTSAIGENAVFKWVATFVAISIIFGYVSISFASPAAQTIAVVSFFFGLLLFMSTLFEKTASA